MKKLTKKYKFVGDSSGWGWDSNPVKGETYDEGQLASMFGFSEFGYYQSINVLIIDLLAQGDWEGVTNEPVLDPLIEKLTNLDNLYLQMIGIVEGLVVDLDEGSIEKCSDPKLGLDLVMGVYKKHRRLVEVLDIG